MTLISNNNYNTLINVIFFIIFLSISNIFLPNLPPGTGLSLFVNNIVWLSSIVFSYIAILSVLNKGYWIKPKNFIIHLSLIFALVLPFLWSDDITGRGFYRMLAAVFGIMFFLCLFTSFSKKKLWHLILVISLSGFIQALWGCMQIWVIPESIIPHGIPMGVFQQPNVMGSYLATTFLVSLLLFSVYPVEFKMLEKWVHVCIYAFSFLVGLLVILLNSSTTYLALIISLPLMLIAHRSKPKKIIIAIIIMLSGCLLAFFLNTGFIESLTGSSVANVNHINVSMSSTLNPGGREHIWIICWEMFKENWLTGVGYGNFEHSFMEYQAHYYQQNGIYAFEKLSHPHNEFILWVVEGGALPAAAFLGYTLYILSRMFKMGTSALPYAATLIPLVAHALLEFPFYVSAIHWILFVTLLFLFEMQEENTISVEINYKPLITTITTVLALVASLFFVTNMHAIMILNKYNETEFSKRNVKTLSAIVNNFTVRPHINYFFMKGLLERGIREKNKSYLKQSVLLLDKLSTNEPRPEYYKNMLIAYEALGDKENFKIRLEQARYLYPLNEYFLGVEERFNSILKNPKY